MTTMNRMPSGYKQTEVGVIPEDWVVRDLGRIGKVIRGASPRPKGDKRFYGGSIPRLMVEDVTRDGKRVTPQVDFLTVEGAKRSRPCPLGTLTVVCSGTVGIPSFLAVDACIHDGFLALVQLDRSVLDDYLFHQLTSLQQRFNLSATHGGVFTNLTTTAFGAFQVAFPPNIEEQRAIATALSDVDALLAAQDKLIAKKRDIKQATMQQLLTGKHRLPGFSGEWELKRLGNIASFYKGKGLAKSELDPYGSELCIHYGELFTRHPETISKILNRTNTTDSVFRSVTNDVLMPTSDVTPNGLARASCVQQTGIILGGDILVIRANPKELNGSFLSYVIRQLREQVMQLVSGTTVFHLYGSDMKKFEFAMTSVVEQQAIVKILDDMDADLAALEQQREKTRALKQGMMQELLTGRIRLV